MTTKQPEPEPQPSPLGDGMLTYVDFVRSVRIKERSKALLEAAEASHPHSKAAARARRKAAAAARPTEPTTPDATPPSHQR